MLKNKIFFLINPLFQNLKACLYHFKDLNKLRKLGKIFSFSNIATTFFTWIHMSGVITNMIFFIFLIFLWILHLTMAFVFIKNGLNFSGSKWLFWGVVSSIPITPLGLILLFYCTSDYYWQVDEEKIKNKFIQTIGHKFNDTIQSIERQWAHAINELNEMEPEFFPKFLKNGLRVESTNFSDWNAFQINVVLAIYLTLKRFKNKSFKNLLWTPHWYDNQHFTFAIKNEKTITSKNPYTLAMGIVVLDEFNNYEKIFSKKSEIKSNLRFSQAKMICLHWGKEYKIYVNQ